MKWPSAFPFNLLQSGMYNHPSLQTLTFLFSLIFFARKAINCRLLNYANELAFQLDCGFCWLIVFIVKIMVYQFVKFYLIF